MDSGRAAGGRSLTIGGSAGLPEPTSNDGKPAGFSQQFDKARSHLKLEAGCAMWQERTTLSQGLVGPALAQNGLQLLESVVPQVGYAQANQFAAYRRLRWIAHPDAELLVAAIGVHPRVYPMCESTGPV